MLRYTLLEPESFERDRRSPQWLAADVESSFAIESGELASVNQSSDASEDVIRQSWSKDERERCAHYYQMVVAHLPPRQSIPAKIMYAGFLAASDMRNDALRIYEQVAKTDHSVCLRAAVLSEELGDIEKAEQHAGFAVEFLKPKVAGDEKSIDWRLELVKAHAILGEYRDALQVLDDGMIASDDPRLPRIAGEVLLRQYREIESDASRDKTKTLFFRASLLTKAVVEW